MRSARYLLFVSLLLVLVASIPSLAQIPPKMDEPPVVGPESLIKCQKRGGNCMFRVNPLTGALMPLEEIVKFSGRYCCFLRGASSPVTFPYGEPHMFAVRLIDESERQGYALERLAVEKGKRWSSKVFVPLDVTSYGQVVYGLDRTKGNRGARTFLFTPRQRLEPGEYAFSGSLDGLAQLSYGVVNAFRIAEGTPTAQVPPVVPAASPTAQTTADSAAPTQSSQTVAQSRQAAEKGDVAAAYRLGVAFRDGIGVPQDYVEAYAWINIAALVGVGADQATYTEAETQLESKMVPSQRAEGGKRFLVVLRRFAEAGHPKAQLALGSFLFMGSPEFGLQQDYALAFDWIRKAATQGQALLGPEDLGRAAFVLGEMYDGGNGTIQDFAKAVQWFRKAAEQGEPEGQLAIGQMYEQGRGVPRDVVEAHKWMNLAASRAPSEKRKKFTDARDQIAQSMTAEQIAEAQKRASEWIPIPPTPVAVAQSSAMVTPAVPAASSAAGALLGGIPEGVVGGVVGGVVEIKEPDGVLRVGGDVKEPVILQRVEPLYPEFARKARIRGSVILEAVVDRTGALKDVRVLEGLPFGLDEAAVDAVKQWRFAPATLNGVPVDVFFKLTVSFKLDALKEVTPVERSPSVAGEPGHMNSGQIAEINTSVGTIVIRLLPDVAPNHVRNFIDLAQEGFYNGTKFHRVIPGFMIQGGDPNTKTADTSSWGTGGSGKYLNAEFNAVHHARGVVSMARAQSPDSASSQFFICVADAGFLDKQYTAFGEVLSGMDVADKIVSGKTTVNDRPADPIEIKSVTIRDAKDGEKGPAVK